MAYSERKKAHLVAKAFRDSRWNIFEQSDEKITIVVHKHHLRFVPSLILTLRRHFEMALDIPCRIVDGGYSCLQFSIGWNDRAFELHEMQKIVDELEFGRFLDDCGVVEMRYRGQKLGQKKAHLHNRRAA